MKYLLFCSFLLLSALKGMAQPAPSSADAIMTGAYQQAIIENKKVFVMFHASWCGWCHKMDNSMNDPACKKFFDDHFVIRYLVVDESKDKKNLENPGAAELRTKYHGDGVGIPFWLVFDKDGKLISDSKIRKEGEGPEQGYNTGCPASEKEVDFFIDLLKKNTMLTESQEISIRKRFRENER